MKKAIYILSGFILGFIIGTVVVSAIASDINLERLWNAVYDSTNLKIRIIGV